MSVAKGYVGTGKTRLPSSLLDACLFWDRAQGGTIHQYLPRLKWEFAGRGWERGSIWHLMLDGQVIGWIQCYKRELPSIDAHFPACHLNHLPEVTEWFE